MLLTLSTFLGQFNNQIRNEDKTKKREQTQCSTDGLILNLKSLHNNIASQFSLSTTVTCKRFRFSAYSKSQKNVSKNFRRKIYGNLKKKFKTMKLCLFLISLFCSVDIFDCHEDGGDSNKRGKTYISGEIFVFNRN